MDQTTSAVVLDAKGVQIKPLSIVRMSDPHGNWSPYQGLVVEPNSDIEGEGYCVAVYFYREVNSSMFRLWYKDESDTIPIDSWDATYKKADSKSKTDFLFVDGLWKRSPRVRFFRPEELVIIPSWDIESLAERLFMNDWHSTFSLLKQLPQTPEAYMCFIKDCRNPATDMALYNVWGSVYPLFVCKACMAETNGLRGDDLPARKDSYLTPDGREINFTPKAR